MSPEARAAALQASLAAWHDELADGPDRPIGEPAARLLVARCVDAIADMRGSAATVMGAAADLIAAGAPERARELLLRALECNGVRSEGRTLQ